MKAELIENRIVVWDVADSRKLFASGFYGKPIGIAKPKPDEFDAPIILDLLEGYFLASNSEIQVYQGGKRLALDKLEKICVNEVYQFKEKLLVYSKLRKSGFVVTPGIKFGADFAAYERGPGLDHAPYLVRVSPPTQRLTATDIVLAGRLATTVRKQFIIAVANTTKEDVSFIGFDWWRA